MINALELLNEIADRLGKPQFETLEEAQPIAEHRKLLRLLNSVVVTLGSHNDWPLLRAEGSILLLDAIEGSGVQYVTATKNSDIVTVAGVTFAETLIGQAFQVVGDDYIYRIIAVPSTTSLQLDRAWANASIVGATDQRTFMIAMDRYALPDDFDRPVDVYQSVFSPYDIDYRTPNELYERRRSDRTIRLSEPEVYTIWGTTDNQSAQVILFDPWPKTARLLRFPYQRVHPTIDSDQDNILYPLTYRTALIDTIVSIAKRDYEDSTKSQQVLLDAIRAHNVQQGNPGVTDSRPRFEPSGITRSQIREAYGIPVDGVDWGDIFDSGRLWGM